MQGNGCKSSVPENSQCVDSQVVNAFPFKTSLETIEQTTSVSACAATDALGFTEATGVWYDIQTDEGTCFIAQTEGSSYNVHMAMYEDRCPAETDKDTCKAISDSKGRLAWKGSAGKSYKIFVGSDGTSGGFLNFQVMVCCSS